MDVTLLSKTILFRGTTPEEIDSMLNCLGAETRLYGKGDTIYRVGDVVGALGVVLAGGVTIENDDLWGNRSILGHVGPGQIFAEAYACVPGEPMMVSAVAAEKSEVLFLDAGRVLTTCPQGCTFHNRLIANLLAVLAQENLNLSRRILHTSAKSIRGRVISYLSFQAARQGTTSFSIPFNRQELADYLGVDRSALSAELGRMQKDGLLTVHKNQFALNPDAFSEEG